MCCGNSILQKGLPFFYLHKIFYTLSVQHGRYNVTNINEKDFIKIVNICSAFVEFNKPNESISFLTE